MSVRLALFSLVALPVSISGAYAAESAAFAQVMLPAPRLESTDIASLRAKADGGNSIAQYNLGLAYAQQRQSPADLIEAFVWLTIAADNGSTGKALENIVPQLTPVQLEEGRRRVQMLRIANPQLRRPRSTGVPQITPVESPSPLAGTEAPSSREAQQLRELLTAAVEDKRQLSNELAAAWKEAERLETELGRRRAEIAAAASAQGSLATAQAAAARQASELATRTAEAEASRAALSRTQTELAQTKSQLEELTANRARATADTTNRVVEDLKQQLLSTETQLREAREAAGRTNTAANAQTAQELSLTRAELQAERTRAEDAARQLAALEATTRDLTVRVQTAAPQEAQLREAQSRLSTLSAEIRKTTSDRNEAQAKAAAAAQELRLVNERTTATEAERTRLAAEIAAATSTHALALQTLSAENRAHTQRLAQLESELARSQSSAQAGARTSGDAEKRVASLNEALVTVRKELAAAMSAVAELAAQKVAIGTATRELSDAQQRLATTTNERDALQAQLAQATATAGSAAQAQALTAKLTADNESLRQRLAQAGTDARTFRETSGGATTQLSTQLDQSRSALTEAQQQLQSTRQELTRLETELSAARALGPQLRQLETEKATLLAQLNAADAARGAMVSSAASTAQSEAEQRLPVVLRSYTLMTQERDTLRAEITALNNKLATSANTIAQMQAEVRAAAATPVTPPRPVEFEPAPAPMLANVVERSTEPAPTEVVRTLPTTPRSEPAPVEFAPLPPPTVAMPAAVSTTASSVVPTAIPSAGVTSTRTATFAPMRPAAVNTSPAAPVVTTGAPVTLLRIHTIVRGDTLSGISRQYYGTPNRWQDILAANRDVLRSERDLIAGRTLRLP